MAPPCRRRVLGCSSTSALHHTRVTPESFTQAAAYMVEHNYVWIRIIPPPPRPQLMPSHAGILTTEELRDSLPDIPRAATGVTRLHARLPPTIHPSCVQVISN